MKIFTLPKVFMAVVSLLVMGSCAVYKDPIYITSIDQGLHMGPENKAGRDLSVGAQEPVRHASGSIGDRLTRMSRPPATQASTIAAQAGAAAPSVPASVQTPKTQVIEACERVAPPIIGQIPRLGPNEIAAISKLSTADANGKLLDELELIYKYASNKNKELQNSFTKQWASCRKVVIVLQ